MHGRCRELGLGSASLVPLAEAREKSRVLRRVARDGGDPETLRRRATLTFWEAAETVHAQLRPTWKNAKHAASWLQMMRTYAKPSIGDRPLESVGTADLHLVLAPIWTEKHDLASRLKQRLGTIFDWAKRAGHYPHENPVIGLKKALPAARRQEHSAALPSREVSAFLAELDDREGLSARCLEFLILTAARSIEARGARWAEIDAKASTWTVPAERMKRGLVHRVPLSPQARLVLERVRGLDADLVFPSPQPGTDGEAQPMSDMTFKLLFNRMKREGVTTHGFRSSFRDWASESAHVEREVAEAAFRSRSFSFSRSFRRFTWSVFRPPNSLRKRESGERRHAERSYRLGHRLALRHQYSHLSEVCENLLRPMLLLRHSFVL